MKIIQLVYHLGAGGAERFVTDLSNELNRQGHDVCLIMIRDDLKKEFSFYNGQLDKGIKIVSLKIDPGFKLSQIKIVEKAILAEKPEIVHGHLNVMPFVYMLALRNRRIHFIHTIHSLPLFDNQSSFQRTIARFFYKSVITPVTITEMCRTAFLKVYGFEPDMITNGRSAIMDSPSFEDVRQELSSFNKPIFVHVARLSPEKNQELLFSSFKILHEKGQNFTLLVIGSGYESMSKESFTYNIHFLGPKDNVGDYLKLSDGFCLTSKVEGCPISLIEALSCGVTPVCTPAGGIPDMIKDGCDGYLSRDMSIDAYEEALEKAIERPIDRKILIDSYRKSFSMSTCAEKYTTIYLQGLLR